MLDWWNSLSLISQIFACIAIPTTLVLIIQTILMFIGLDSDGIGDMDGDFALDHDHIVLICTVEEGQIVHRGGGNVAHGMPLCHDAGYLVDPLH